MPRTRSSKLTLQNYREMAEFRYLLRKFLTFSENAARDAGLAPQQHQALLAIKGFPSSGPPTVGDLAVRLGIRHHSAVGLIDRLSEAGWVRRSADKKDRRRVVLSLTKSGEAKLSMLSSAHREELKRLAPLLKVILAKIEG